MTTLPADKIRAMCKAPFIDAEMKNIDVEGLRRLQSECEEHGRSDDAESISAL